MENILSRINQIALKEHISMTGLEQRIGASKGVLSRALKKETDIQSKWLMKIYKTFPGYNAGWILSGEGDMLQQENAHLPKRIPLYKDIDEVRSVDEPDSPYKLSYINPGDWFPGATIATLYYNNSMKEYAPGSMLILRQKYKIEELIWGEHYIIEYGDNRLLREIQPSEDKDFIYAYATNEATYADGRYKYPPVRIFKEDIKGIFQVLGYVCKRQDSGAAIYNVE